MASDSGKAGEEAEFTIRRSSRRKRHRSEWEETLVMQVRTSRASGDSEQIAVTTRGGKPSHNKSREKTQEIEVVTLAKFCSECGMQHGDKAKFCMNCGTKRSLLKQPSQPSQPLPSQTPQSPEPKQPIQAVVSLVAPETTTGRTYKKTFLRCGWQLLHDGLYIAPDGKKFSNRADASKYHNKDVAKLEPARKDGWQVFTNAAGTHTDWIAPDGNKLYSYSSAVIYGKKSSQPLLGMDGITKNIQKYFAPTSASTSKPKSAHSSARKTVNTSRKKNFTIPGQTEAGVELQKLCRLLEGKVKCSRRTVLEEQIAQYLKPRSIGKSLANKVDILQQYQCPT